MSKVNLGQTLLVINQVILITGQSPNQEIIDKIFSIVANMENVKKVNN